METTNTPAVQQSSPVYFKKEILSTAYIANGAAVHFEVLDGNIGVLALLPGIDDGLIKALNEAAAKHKGGILKINEETYQNLKKNRPYNPSAKKRPDMLQLMQSAAAPMFKPHLPEPVAGSAVPVAPKIPAPISAPLLQPLPATGEKPAYRPSVSRPSQRVPQPAAPITLPAQ